MEKLIVINTLRQGTWWCEAYCKDAWLFLWILEWFAVFEDECLVKNWLSEGLWKPGKGNNYGFNNQKFSNASLTV